MARFVLIGLAEPPSAEQQEQFDEWFVDEHIEDTAKCPNFVRGSVFKLSGPHGNGNTVSQYLSLYEVEAPSYEEAERVLNAWQRDPDAWEGRLKHRETGERLGTMPLRINAGTSSSSRSTALRARRSTPGGSSRFRRGWQPAATSKRGAHRKMGPRQGRERSAGRCRPGFGRSRWLNRGGRRAAGGY